jgi:mycofactocin precursor
VWGTDPADPTTGSGAPMTDPVQTPTDTETDAPTAELAETALVEEVSIDGMCGVY